MAYAKRFYGKWFGRDGYAYQVFLEQDGYEGAASEVVLREEPLVLGKGRRGIDQFSPIRAGYARISIWKTVEDQFDVFDGAASDEWQVRVVRGTTQTAIDGDTYTERFLGFLILDNFEDSTSILPTALDLEAIDGFERLRNTPYIDTSEDPQVPFEGVEKVRVIAKRCLDLIGLTLPYETASRLFPDGVTPNVDPWDNLELDNAQFINNKGQALSAYDVLKICCYRTLSIVYQLNGKWHFRALDILTGSSHTVYRYTDTGTTDGSYTSGAAIDIDTLFAAGSILRLAGRRGRLQPVSAASLVFNHGLIPNLLHAGDFEGTKRRLTREGSIYGEDPDDYWARSGTGVIFRTSSAAVTRSEALGQTVGATRSTVSASTVLFIPEITHGFTRDLDAIRGIIVAGGGYGSQESETVEAGERVSFSGEVRITKDSSSDGLYPIWYHVQIVGSEYILLADGTWHDGTSETLAEQLQVIVPVDEAEDFGETGAYIGTTYGFRITSQPAPVEGTLLITLFGTSNYGAETNVEGVEWDNLSVLVVDEEGEQTDKRLTQVYIQGADRIRETIELPVGPGPRSFMHSAVKWSGTAYEDFVTDLLTVADDLDVITAETWLRFVSTLLERRSETFIDLGYDFGFPLTIGTKNFFPTFTEKSLRFDRDEMEVVQHEFDSTSTVISGTTGDVGEGLVIQSSSSSVGATPNSLGTLPITTKGDLIVGNASGLPERLAVGADGQVLVARSAQPSGVRWENIESGGGGGESADVSDFVPLYALFESVKQTYRLSSGFYLVPDESGGDVIYATAAEIAAGAVGGP